MEMFLEQLAKSTGAIVSIRPKGVLQLTNVGNSRNLQGLSKTITILKW